MSSSQISNLNIARIALRLMMLVGIIAMVNVILQSCNLPKEDYHRFAKGSLKKLTVISPTPAQPVRAFKNVSGDNVALKDFRGQLVLLNVWATWCAPCVAEIPSLDKLQAEYENFAVIVVSMDRHMVDAQSFYKTAGINHLKLYHDPQLAMARDVNVQGLPISIFYDKTGVEIARIPGEVDWQSAEVRTFLEEILR